MEKFEAIPNDEMKNEMNKVNPHSVYVDVKSTSKVDDDADYNVEEKMDESDELSLTAKARLGI